MLSQRADASTYQANGPVNAVVTVGTTTYLGGDFTSVRPAGSDVGTNETPRAHLAAVNNVTGALLPWNPGANGSVYSLAASPDGSTIYAGGSFGVLGGTTHRRIGAVTASGGTAVARVRSGRGRQGVRDRGDGDLGVRRRLFRDGRRSGAGQGCCAQRLRRLAPHHVGTGHERRRQVDRALPDGRYVYVAGEFTSVNNVPREKFITKLSPTTAAVTPLATHPGYPIWSVVVTSDAIFVGGNGAGGHASQFTTSGVQVWKFQTDGGVQAVYYLNGVLYVGGHFDNVCTGDTDGPTTNFHCPAGTVGATRHKLVAVVPNSSSSLGYDVDAWDPGANSPLGVFAMSSDGSSIQLGGEFTTIGLGTLKQQAYAEFSVNYAPVPSFTSSCTGLTCSFNARESTDTGGPIAGYDWDFGDGTTAVGATATHTWTRNGTPSVTLTVTDNEGQRSTLTKTVAVGSAPPVARLHGRVPGHELCSRRELVDRPGRDGHRFRVDLLRRRNGQRRDRLPRFSAAGAGTYDITLTVTDNTGGTATSTQTVQVSPPATSPIAFVDGSGVAVNKSATTFAAKVPAAVHEGDLMLLTADRQQQLHAADPAGWTKVGTRLISSDGTNGSSTVWQRTATSSDVATPSGTLVLGHGEPDRKRRAALTLTAYRGSTAA